MPTDIGTGATLSFTGDWDAEILSLSWDGISREAIDTSHMGTTVARTFIPTDLYDPGELTVEFNLDPDYDIETVMTATAETVAVVLQDGAGTANWSASGFMTSYSLNAPLEDKQTGSATIKLSGSITIT